MPQAIGPRAGWHDRRVDPPSGGPATTSSAEPLPEYDPRLPAFRASRHAVYRRLRQEAPASFSERAGAWIITRYEDVVAILLDTARFSADNSIGIAPFETMHDDVRAALDRGYPRFPGIIEMDPPTHTAYRSVVNLAFTPGRVAALEPSIRRIANELIDDLRGRTDADFVKVFGDPLPIRVIGEILGVPPRDTATVQELSDSFRMLEAGTIGLLPVDEQVRIAERFVEFQRYVAAMITDRRAHPCDDLVSVICQARLDDGRLLDLDELVSTVIHLLFAGQETTTRLLAGCVHLLLRERRLWDELVADPTLAAAAVEEGLRLDPPVTYHLRRARVPVTIDGVTIPAGGAVHLVFASANRDEAAFPEPDAFDLHRPNASRHLGFGRGIHFCVGAPVGRMEGRIGLQVLAARLPTLALVEPGEPLREPHVMLSGIASLPVRWNEVDPRPAG